MSHVGVPCKMIKAASWQPIKALSFICGISILEKTFIFSLETREKELIMKMNVNFNFSSYFWRIEMCTRNPVVVFFKDQRDCVARFHSGNAAKLC